jgi:hypothetical protein
MVDLYTSDEIKPEVKPKTPSPVSPKRDPGQVKMERNEPHILASFHENPEGIRFANQDSGEEVLLFLRRHYITNLSWQLATIVFVMLPLLAFATFPYLNLSLPIAIPSNYILILVLFYYLIVFGYAFVSFIVWFYNVGIISNHRVIDIDINGISSKDIAATELKDIIDISYKQSGLQQSLFDFGDVFMETEAEKPNFEFISVPHPAKVTDLISKLNVNSRRE